MADITLTGNLGSDAELTFTPNGKAKLEFSVGDTPRRLNQQTNEWEDAGETTWWRVTEWERKAEFWADHLMKGTKVVVTGTAAVRSYEKKDGTKGFSAEVKPKSISVVPKAANKQQGQQQPRTQQAQQQDPWATPAVANAGGWGNGPDSEPPF
jgi:single-strand DNA-binding protein